jgi:hypothetical protein
MLSIDVAKLKLVRNSRKILQHLEFIYKQQKNITNNG